MVGVEHHDQVHPDTIFIIPSCRKKLIGPGAWSAGARAKSKIARPPSRQTASLIRNGPLPRPSFGRSPRTDCGVAGSFSTISRATARRVRLEQRRRRLRVGVASEAIAQLDDPLLPELTSRCKRHQVRRIAASGAAGVARQHLERARHRVRPGGRASPAGKRTPSSEDDLAPVGIEPNALRRRRAGFRTAS